MRKAKTGLVSFVKKGGGNLEEPKGGSQTWEMNMKNLTIMKKDRRVQPYYALNE